MVLGLDRVMVVRQQQVRVVRQQQVERVVRQQVETAVRHKVETAERQPVGRAVQAVPRPAETRPRLPMVETVETVVEEGMRSAEAQEPSMPLTTSPG